MQKNSTKNSQDVTELKSVTHFRLCNKYFLTDIQ